MAISLIKRLIKGSALTWAEMDNNLGLIENSVNVLINTCPVIQTQTVTLAKGEDGNIIGHGLNRKARLITFIRADGEVTNYRWKREPDAEYDNIIIWVPDETPDAELVDTEINIYAV